MSRYFITATDTDAGKTTVSCALLDYFNQKQRSTLALKPVATGCDTKNLKSEDDIALLHQHMSLDLPAANINHFYHPVPAAPSIANPDHPPTTQALVQFCHQCMQEHPADVTLIEGAGGWLCPLNDHQSLAELPQALNIPTLLVVGLKLGSINHALLSEFHVKQSGRLLGWIANFCDPDTTHSDAMLQLLKKHMKTPLLATLNYQNRASKAKTPIRLIRQDLFS